MAAETGIDKTVAGKEGVEGTVAEETPEALREQIKKLKGNVKFFKYASFIGIPAMYALSLAMMAGLLLEQPVRIYSVLKTQDGKAQYKSGDLDGNGVPDLVLEHNDRGLTPFFGHKFGDGAITYVKYDKMKKLNPNSIVDYECINDKLMSHSAFAIWTDEQRKNLDEDRKALEEQGFNPIIVDNTCFKGSSHHK